jgi:hypothetical protein
VVLTWADPLPPSTLNNYGYVKVGNGMSTGERIK